MDFILKLDVYLFKMIHEGFASPISDNFFSYITDMHKEPMFKFYIFPALLILWLLKRKTLGLIQILLLALAILTTDTLSHKVLKPMIQRPRPQYAGLEVNKKSVSGTSKYSFPSNHAANIFCAATLLSSFFPFYRIPFYFFAVLIGYSRVYLGVHYPLDVAGGALLGFIIAIIIIETTSYVYLNSNLKYKKNKPTTESRYKKAPRSKNVSN